LKDRKVLEILNNGGVICLGFTAGDWGLYTSRESKEAKPIPWSQIDDLRKEGWIEEDTDVSFPACYCISPQGIRLINLKGDQARRRFWRYYFVSLVCLILIGWLVIWMMSRN
jgi:hypothetical protein